MKAILLVSHGSRLQKTKEEVILLVDSLQKRLPDFLVSYAFLEIEPPSISEGIDACVVKGARDIIVLMNFLNTGRHVENDIPAIVDKAKIKYPGIFIRMSQPVGQHPQIADLFLDLIKNA